MEDTYTGEHIKEEWKDVPIRYSIITSIGCSKTCSFCGNPYIYRIGFKNKQIVRELIEEYVAHGIDRVSVHDMYFVMSESHAYEMMEVFQATGVRYSMQTCLENLTDQLLDDLKASGLQKFLVGIENPVSHTVGKTVEMERVHWLLDAVQKRRFEGVKLSYIVGLPGVKIEDDMALLQHIISEVSSLGHPLEDLQVNLYTPYRPEAHTHYLPYGEAAPAQGQSIFILTKIPYSFWGSFPIGFAEEAELRTQMILCDVTFEMIYTEFKDKYLETRELYLQELSRSYPHFRSFLPTYAESVDFFNDRSGTLNFEAMLDQAIHQEKFHLIGLR